MNILDKINNLCFDLQHGDELTKEQWDKVDQIFELSLPMQLNENQQVVLEWLKNIYNGPIMINPIGVVFSLHNEFLKGSEIDAVGAYVELGFDEEIQVLQVFSQWALEQEDE